MPGFALGTRKKTAIRDRQPLCHPEPAPGQSGRCSRTEWCTSHAIPILLGGSNEGRDGW